MSSLALSVKKLNELVQQRQLLEGIERFYADDVVMVEGSAGPSTAGKAANRERERVFVDGLTKWDAKLIASAVDETTGVALNQWTIGFSHSSFGEGVLEQVAVQQWRDGRIVHEAFYKI